MRTVFAILILPFLAMESSAQDMTKRFSAIAPSALSLIRLKADTEIPFAKETAALMDFKSVPPEGKVDFRKLIHFENRYWTIDKMLELFPAANLLEFSSGYSFRGLELCRNDAVYFIDTDLPEVIRTKQVILDSLFVKNHLTPIGKLQLQPLDVFNLADFQKTIDLLPAGPVTIVNEGLLPYFNHEEKTRLCENIRAILRTRGGYWITADVYVKDESDSTAKPIVASAFRQEHHLDENRFDNYEAAKRFFEGIGFEVVGKIAWDFDRLSSLKQLPEVKRRATIEKLKLKNPVRETWCLKVKAR